MVRSLADRTFQPRVRHVGPKALGSGACSGAVPKLFIWTKYDSTGSGVIFRPACLSTLFSLSKWLERNSEVIWIWTEKILEIQLIHWPQAFISYYPQVRQSSVNNAAKDMLFGSGFSDNLHRAKKDQKWNLIILWGKSWNNPHNEKEWKRETHMQIAEHHQQSAK